MKSDKASALEVPVDSDTISAEARSAGVRTPKLPEVPTEADEKDTDKEKKTAETKANTTKPVPPSSPPAPAPGSLDDFDALTARFAALKKR